MSLFIEKCFVLFLFLYIFYLDVFPKMYKLSFSASSCFCLQNRYILFQLKFIFTNCKFKLEKGWQVCQSQIFNWKDMLQQLLTSIACLFLATFHRLLGTLWDNFLLSWKKECLVFSVLIFLVDCLKKWAGPRAETRATKWHYTRVKNLLGYSGLVRKG